MLKNFQIFTNGVIHLMKRKFQEGVDSLSSLKKLINSGDFLMPLIYIYRYYILIYFKEPMDIFVLGNIKRQSMIWIIFRNFKNLSYPLSTIRLFAKELYKIFVIIGLDPSNILIKRRLFIRKKWTFTFIRL